MDCLCIAKFLVSNDYGVFAQESDTGHVGVPDHVLDEGSAELCQGDALLHIKEGHLHMIKERKSWTRVAESTYQTLR